MRQWGFQPTYFFVCFFNDFFRGRIYLMWDLFEKIKSVKFQFHIDSFHQKQKSNCVQWCLLICLFATVFGAPCWLNYTMQRFSNLFFACFSENAGSSGAQQGRPVMRSGGATDTDGLWLQTLQTFSFLFCSSSSRLYCKDGFTVGSWVTANCKDVLAWHQRYTEANALWNERVLQHCCVL